MMFRVVQQKTPFSSVHNVLKINLLTSIQCSKNNSEELRYIVLAHYLQEYEAEIEYKATHAQYLY